MSCSSSRETELVLSESIIRKCSSLLFDGHFGPRGARGRTTMAASTVSGTAHVSVEATDSVEGGIRASSRASGDHSPSGPG